MVDNGRACESAVADFVEEADRHNEKDFSTELGEDPRPAQRKERESKQSLASKFSEAVHQCKDYRKEGR